MRLSTSQRSLLNPSLPPYRDVLPNVLLGNPLFEDLPGAKLVGLAHGMCAPDDGVATNPEHCTDCRSNQRISEGYGPQVDQDVGRGGCPGDAGESSSDEQRRSAEHHEYRDDQQHVR